jgi:hypothetical protein
LTGRDAEGGGARKRGAHGFGQHRELRNDAALERRGARRDFPLLCYFEFRPQPLGLLR